MEMDLAASAIEDKQRLVASKPSMSLNSESTEDRECRNCHEPGGDLIAPCHCTGSIKWVHRQCLNEWRAVSPNPSSFSMCDVCAFEYQLHFKEEGRNCMKLKFAFLVSRDFLLFLLAVNIATTLCSVFLWGVDRHRERDHLFTDYLHWHPPSLFMDWVFGWLLFFFIIGLLGIMLGIAKLCGGLELCCLAPTYSTHNYGFTGYYCYFCWLPDTSCSSGSGGGNCGGGNCGGGSNCGSCSGGDCKGDCKGSGEGILIVIAVIVIAIILLGIVIGLTAAVLLGVRIVQRHIHVLHNRHRAGQWEVLDLSTDEEFQGGGTQTNQKHSF